ncbi:MAG: restriction endonuclease subunit S [Kiritimatiellae bacterium]|nr:restriction endonuclease subunit S [Kiritimatiellia bacterium]
MASDWTAKTFENGPLKILDGDRGKNYPSRNEFTDHGHCVFLNTGNVTTDGFKFESVDFISDERDRLLRKGKLQREDVVLTTRGTVGNVAYFDDSIHFDHIRINSGMVILRPSVEDLEPRFLYLFVRSHLFSEQVASLTSGSAQPQLPIRDLKRVEIPLPPLPEQKAIAHILGSLDDKIELNRRMNETLEGMAQELFKSWFVDFDPVIDNILMKNMTEFLEQNQPSSPLLPEGEEPLEAEQSLALWERLGEGAFKGIPYEFADRAETRRIALTDGTANREIAKAFPSSFIETDEMGWIPEGWKVEEIEELCPFVSRGVTPKYQDGSGRFIINQKVNRGAELDFSNLKELEEGLNVPAQKFAQRCDVLVNCLGEGTLGRTHFFSGDSDVYAVDQHMTICRPEDPETGLFLYLYLSSPRGKDRIEAAKTGSTGMTMLNIKRVRSFGVPFPTDQALKLFGTHTLGHYAKIQGNRENSGTLSKLRDTLLPKLISGELRIEDAEKMVGEMA